MAKNKVQKAEIEDERREADYKARMSSNEYIRRTINHFLSNLEKERCPANKITDLQIFLGNQHKNNIGDGEADVVNVMLIGETNGDLLDNVLVFCKRQVKFYFTSIAMGEQRNYFVEKLSTELSGYFHNASIHLAVRSSVNEVVEASMLGS